MSDGKQIQLEYARPGVIRGEPSAFWSVTGIVVPNVLGGFCGAALSYLLISNTLAKYDFLFVSALSAAFFSVVGLLGAIERSKFLLCWNGGLFVMSVAGFVAAGLM